MESEDYKQSALEAKVLKLELEAALARCKTQLRKEFGSISSGLLEAIGRLMEQMGRLDERLKSLEAARVVADMKPKHEHDEEQKESDPEDKKGWGATLLGWLKILVRL